MAVKSLNDSNNQDRVIVIDNTPFPSDGAMRKNFSHYLLICNSAFFSDIDSLIKN